MRYNEKKMEALVDMLLFRRNTNGPEDVFVSEEVVEENGCVLLYGDVFLHVSDVTIDSVPFNILADSMVRPVSDSTRRFIEDSGGQVTLTLGMEIVSRQHNAPFVFDFETNRLTFEPDQNPDIEVHWIDIYMLVHTPDGYEEIEFARAPDALYDLVDSRVTAAMLGAGAYPAPVDTEFDPESVL